MILLIFKVENSHLNSCLDQCDYVVPPLVLRIVEGAGKACSAGHHPINACKLTPKSKFN
jgi:hypothetical protein